MPDWKKIKTEYITTGISQRKLAEKLEIPYQTLRDRANKEKWATQKKDYGNKTVQKATEIISKKQAEVLANEYRIANKLVDMIERQIVEDDVNIADIDRAATALSKLMNIKSFIKGVESKQEKDAHDIAVRRMNLEEKKANISDADGNTINVNISNPEAKEWNV